MKARRVYYESDLESTQPDYQLESAFEHTNPGVEPFAFEDAPTGEWLLPTMVGLSLLVGGFFLGRWWVGRKKTEPTMIAGDVGSGLDELGAA